MYKRTHSASELTARHILNVAEISKGCTVEDYAVRRTGWVLGACSPSSDHRSLTGIRVALLREDTGSEQIRAWINLSIALRFQHCLYAMLRFQRCMYAVWCG